MSLSMEDLDDTNKACVCIPYAEERDSSVTIPEDAEPVSFQSLADPIARLISDAKRQAYSNAWKKSLDKIEGLVRDIHAHVVEDIVHEIAMAYSPNNLLPGLPYSELPILCLVAAQSSSLTELLDKAQERLTSRNKSELTPENEASERASGSAITVHLGPPDMFSLQSAMKNLVYGFVNQNPHLDNPSPATPKSWTYRPPFQLGNSRSLGAYDINLLIAWYGEVVRSRMHLTDEESHNSRLVVFVHEFEAIDAQVMSDMWEVCSMHVSELPFVFVLCLSVPPPDAGVTSIAMSLQDTSILTTPWYLSRHYPRSALALLRVRTFTVPSGQPITEDIVLKTFYDPAFAPTLTPGSGVLDSILEHISRTDSGWVTASTGFQLAHMKHFEVEPLSFFALGMFEGKPLRQCIEDMLSTGVHSHTLEEMLRTLRERLSASTSREVISNSESRRRAEVVAMKGVEDLASLLDAVDEARRTFHTRARSFKMAFQLLLRVREWMLAHGYRSADPAASQAQANSDEHGAPVLKLLLRITKGEASRDIRWLGMMIKKLSAVQTHSLLSSLRELEEVVSPDSSDVGWAQTRIATYLENLSKLLATQSEGFNNGGEHNPFVGEGESSHACQTSREFGEWFVEWAQEQLTPLDKCTLWEIWYTGSAPFPVEMLNPAPRKAVVSALYHPVGYIGIAQQPDAPSDVAKHNKNVRIWELPDTSILFRGYLEAGRMINVYDWYESFAVVLEQQRDMQIRLVEVQQCTDRGAGSRRSIRKGKMSTAGRRSRDDGGQISARHKEEMEEEIWKMEIRARFMRALHELDRLGLIKHTGRKADHVIKTVYDQLE